MDPRQDQSVTDYLTDWAKKGFSKLGDVASDAYSAATADPMKTLQHAAAALPMEPMSTVATAMNVGDAVAMPKKADPMAKPFEQEDYQSASYKPPYGNEVPAAPAAPIDTAVAPETDIGDDDEEKKKNPKVASSHPGFNQAELERYLQNEKGEMDKYGADKQKEDFDSLRKRQGSWQNQAARGILAGADGLMMGVARAGNPGYLAHMDAHQHQQLADQTAMGKDLNEQNMAAIKMKEGLDNKSSQNPLGASVAAAMMPILKKINPGMSDAQLAEMAANPEVAKGLLPEGVKMYDADRKLDAAKMQKELALRTHQDQFDETRIQGLSRSLSADREFTNLRTKHDTLENVGKLIEQIDTQKGGADTRQSMELALAQVRTLIGTGQITESEVHHMMPQTYRGNVAKFMEKVTNEPQGQESQYFLSRAKDFFHRENALTQTQMERRYSELAAPFKKVLDRNGDVRASMETTYKGRSGPALENHGAEKSSVPEIADEASYKALPSGAQYTQNGVLHRKK
jgi:hypothetical protein